eukprot:6204283-Pleurochrysis_carterae.AAC.1
MAASSEASPPSQWTPTDAAASRPPAPPTPARRQTQQEKSSFTCILLLNTSVCRRGRGKRARESGKPRQRREDRNGEGVEQGRSRASRVRGR